MISSDLGETTDKNGKTNETLPVNNCKDESGTLMFEESRKKRKKNLKADPELDRMIL